MQVWDDAPQRCARESGLMIWSRDLFPKPLSGCRERWAGTLRRVLGTPVLPREGKPLGWVTVTLFLVLGVHFQRYLKGYLSNNVFAKAGKINDNYTMRKHMGPVWVPLLSPSFLCLLTFSLVWNYNVIWNDLWGRLLEPAKQKWSLFPQKVKSAQLSPERRWPGGII